MSYKIKDSEQFQLDCDKKHCPRKTLYNAKTCTTDYKRNACYKQYVNKAEKDNAKLLNSKSVDKNFRDLNSIDIEYETFKQSIWMRDYGSYDGKSVKQNWAEVCVFWNSIFTLEEKKYILKNHNDDLIRNRNIDVVHIESQARRPDLKLDKNNVILGGRYFHALLDEYKDLVTQKNMTHAEREVWLDRMKNYIKENI